MKFWSIITLTVFLNFMVLPSMATIFNWDIPATNVVVSEEETSHAPLIINEKNLPKTLNVHDFLKFLKSEENSNLHSLADDSIHLSIFLTIFSPPPNKLI